MDVPLSPTNQTTSLFTLATFGGRVLSYYNPSEQPMTSVDEAESTASLADKMLSRIAVGVFAITFYNIISFGSLGAVCAVMWIYASASFN